MNDRGPQPKAPARDPGITIKIAVHGDTTTLIVTGRILHGPTGSDRLRKSFLDALCPATRAIIIDLSETEAIDASGLGILALAHREALSLGKSLSITNATACIQDLFRITGLSKFFLRATGAAK